MKRGKKEVKENFYLTILLQFDKPKSLVQIAEDLNISKQKLNYYIKGLKNKGFIRMLGYGTWDITPLGRREVKNSSIGIRDKPIINLHALNIQVPILKDNSKADFYDYSSSMRNWIAEYKKLEDLRVTLRKTTKNIDIYVWAREIKDPDDIEIIGNKALHNTKWYLENKGIIIDYINAKTKTKHLSIKEKFLEEVFGRGFKINIELERELKKIFEKDEGKAEVWTDPTPFRGIETNDIEYARLYLMMPENIDRLIKLTLNQYNQSLMLNKNIEELNKATILEIQNKKLHQKVLEEMLRTLINIRLELKGKELVKKVKKIFNQTQLSDF